VNRFFLAHALRAWTRFSIRALGLPCCVTPSFNRKFGGIGLSTDCPSPTPFGLGLGPGLPWADEPSPGILRLSAGRILTCLFAYLYRHYHFSPVHSSLPVLLRPDENAPLPSRSSKFDARCSIYCHFCMILFSCLPKWSYSSLSSSYWVIS
jgi:hypothetical protein